MACSCRSSRIARIIPRIRSIPSSRKNSSRARVFSARKTKSWTGMSCRIWSPIGSPCNHSSIILYAIVASMEPFRSKRGMLSILVLLDDSYKRDALLFKRLENEKSFLFYS